LGWTWISFVDNVTCGGGVSPRGTLAMEGHITGLQQFLIILTSADNIPIMGMMLLVLFFTYLAFRQARRNDQLIAEGRRDQIIEEMRK